MTASERLRRKVELALPAYGAPLDLLLRHPNARELFPGCLTISYHVSRAMVPLMETDDGASLSWMNNVDRQLVPSRAARGLASSK